MKRLAGRFVLERELGSGGMAAVFLGTDEVLDRLVAIKILKRGLGPEISLRFRREGRTAARLSHPNIVQVYDAGEGELDGREVSFIVMEYVPGGDLKDLIDERGPMSAGELAKLGEEAAAGLAHAHERGVIHRDVKPHNILLDERGHPKLTDFGIARALDATTSNPTRTGAYLGTALYSSPEQLQGEVVTPKSDIYSLGATLYQAATGKPPFSGSPISVANQHVSKPPPPPREENAEIGGELEALILACLAKDPGERPSAGELRSRLSKLEEATGDTPPVTPPIRAASAEDTRTISGGVAHRRRRGSSRAVLAMLVLLAAFALVAAIAVPALLGDGSQERQIARQDNGRGGGLAQRQSDQKPNSSSAGGGENTSARASPVTISTPEPTTSQATPEPTEPPRPAGLTKEAAEQTVLDMYVSAARGDYGTSYSYLSRDYRQTESRAEWAGLFTTLQRIEFVQGPTARVSGNTATVTGTTRATHTDHIERNVGTWTLVNEGDEWKVSNISVRRA